MEYGSAEMVGTMTIAIGIGIGIGYLVWGREKAGLGATRPTSAPKAEAVKAQTPAAESPAAETTETAAEPATQDGEGPAAPGNLLTRAPDAPDDLKKIKGIGPKMEALLNERGVYLYSQLAAFTEADLVWLDAATGSFPGRAARDAWVAQAKALAEGDTPQ